MNFLEIFGLIFLAVVIINITIAVCALKHAPTEDEYLQRVNGE